MVGTRNTRILFHLALTLYFAMSLSLFFWYGSKYGYTLSTKNEMSISDAISINLTVSFRSIDTELANENDGKTGNLADKNSFENIRNDEEYNKIRRDDAHYLETLYDSDKKQMEGEIDYIENYGDVRINKEDGDLREDNNNSKHMSRNRSVVAKLLRMVKKQNSLYKHQVVRRIKAIDVFYISAIATDRSRDPKMADREMSNSVAINGWQGRKYAETDLYCCFKRHEPVYSTKVFRRNKWDNPHIGVVTAAQFICNISSDVGILNQTLVGLSASTACEQVEYIELEVELPPPSSRSASFAICSKILYGNFPASRLLEWFEMNIALGVDQFSIFTYNVTKETQTVLNHYQKEGFLVVKEFDFPLKKRYLRYLGQKYMMAYMDEQVAVFDCVQRFRRYTYIAVIDVDEYIMPRMGHTNYKSMMETLLAENPKAAGFTLMTSLFILDWEKTHPEANFTIGQYTLRTPPIWDRRKSIVISERVKLPSVWTHGFSCKEHFHRVYLYKTKAVLNHFRKCRPSWIEHDTCQNNRHQIQDLSMKNFLSKIRNTLLFKRKMLLNY